MAKKNRKAPPSGVMQLALEGLSVTTTARDIMAETVRSIEKYIDTTTWMLIHIAPNRYCIICHGENCKCGAGPMPPLEHEQLKLCDLYVNIGDAVPHLAEGNNFPVGSIFVTKNRTAVSCQLCFKQVCAKQTGKIFLRDDIPVREIERTVDWRRVLTIVNLRLDRQLNRSDFGGGSDQYEDIEQLDFGPLEP